MTFPAKLAFIRPIWFVAILVVAFAVPIATMTVSVEIMAIGAIMSMWLALLPLAWIYGIYTASRLARPDSGPGRDFVFYLAGLGIVLLPVIFVGTITLGNFADGPMTVVGLLWFATFGCLVASMWLASAALVAFEEGVSGTPFYKVAGTFLLMVYWVIGVWVMQDRLKALRHKLEAAPE
jgi:hypothetical protein